MVKDAPNHGPMNIIGLAHTTHKILEYGDVPIFPVVLITPDSLKLRLHHYRDLTGIPLFTFCVEVNTICILP